METMKLIRKDNFKYNTTRRMTNLFVKIVNQIITNCKFNIVNFRNIKLGLNLQGSTGSLTDNKIQASDTFDDSNLWDENLDELIAILRICLQLRAKFGEIYHDKK